MRKTGKLYYLTLFSALASVLASASLVTWDQSTGWFPLWFSIVPSGFGISSMITSTLIVSFFFITSHLPSNSFKHLWLFICYLIYLQALIASVNKEDFAIVTGISYLFRWVVYDLCSLSDLRVGSHVCLHQPLGRLVRFSACLWVGR